MNSEARPDAPVRYGKGGPNARCGPMSDDSGDEEGSGDESRALRAHKYLGTLQAVAKPKEIRDGAKAVLPLIVFSQLVLFPGETLPLIIPSGVDGFGSIIDGKCAVGILWAEHADGRWRLSRVGTVAQVVSTVVSVHSDRARVICKGMRRFTLLGSMARQGRLHGFRFRDPLDNRSCAPSIQPSPADQVLGTGDGVTAAFQLVKLYASGAQSWTRIISKPVEGSVRAAIDGAETPVATDHTTGLITFDTPPAPGAMITAGFAFDCPVRFDTDRLDLALDTVGAGAVPHVPLVELI